MYTSMIQSKIPNSFDLINRLIQIITYFNMRYNYLSTYLLYVLSARGVLLAWEDFLSLRGDRGMKCVTYPSSQTSSVFISRGSKEVLKIQPLSSLLWKIIFKTELPPPHFLYQENQDHSSLIQSCCQVNDVEFRDNSL